MVNKHGEQYGLDITLIQLTERNELEIISTPAAASK